MLFLLGEVVDDLEAGDHDPDQRDEESDQHDDPQQHRTAEEHPVEGHADQRLERVAALPGVAVVVVDLDLGGVESQPVERDHVFPITVA